MDVAMKGDVARIVSSSGPEASKIDSLRAILKKSTSAGNAPSILSLLSCVLSEGSRMTSASLQQAIRDVAFAALSLSQDLALQTVEGVCRILQPHATTFGTILGDYAAATYEFFTLAKNDLGVARSIAAFPPESLGKSRDDSARRLLLGASCFIRSGDVTSAEGLLNRAGAYVADESVELQLEYKLSMAEIQDGRRKFAEAASNFYALSLVASFPTSQRAEMLRRAALAAVLADAGPKRSHLLALIYKDERSKSFPFRAVLEKVFLERLLVAADMVGLVEQLQPFQKAPLENGETPVNHAMIEHNLRSAKNVYVNVSIVGIASLLGISADEAEKTAARMIREGRLDAKVDEVDGFIHFDPERTVVHSWNDQIERVCTELSAAVSSAATPPPAAVASSSGTS